MRVNIFLSTLGEKMTSNLGIIQQNNKFIVTKNGKPIDLPKSDGVSVTIEFPSKEDAEKYISILLNLSRRKSK